MCIIISKDGHFGQLYVLKHELKKVSKKNSRKMAGKYIVYAFVSWNRREYDTKFAKFYENLLNM